MIENFTPAGFPLQAYDEKARTWKTVIGWTKLEGLLAPVVVTDDAGGVLCTPQPLAGPTSYVRP